MRQPEQTVDADEDGGGAPRGKADDFSLQVAHHRAAPGHILALLDVDAFKRFQLATARMFDVRRVALSTLEAHLAEPGANLVVIDPSQWRPEAFIAVVDNARSQRNTAVLVYAALTRGIARIVVDASRRMPIETVFFGAHNEQDALAYVCEKLLVASVPALLLLGLSAE